MQGWQQVLDAGSAGGEQAAIIEGQVRHGGWGRWRAVAGAWAGAGQQPGAVAVTLAAADRTIWHTRTTQHQSQAKRLEELDKVYRDEVVARKRAHNALEDAKGKIRVFARVRPLLEFETAKKQVGGWCVCACVCCCACL